MRDAPVSFDVDASLFRIASMFQSTEETRYYLNGVHIEPHHDQGVFLVATDGRRMLVAHDLSGKIDGGTAIVQLGKDQLKACKIVRGEEIGRRIVANGTRQPLNITAIGSPVAVQAKWDVDGTFPNWKRVMQGINGAGHIEAFDAKLMKSFADAGEALCASPRIDVSYASPGGPVLVRFNVSHVVGVIMPVRWTGVSGWPGFLGFEPFPATEAEPSAETEPA